MPILELAPEPAMKFDPARYYREMARLVNVASKKLATEHPAVDVYTVSIWTDPDAAVSAVSFDTVENSAAKVAAIELDAQRTYERLVADGDVEMAQFFAPNPARTRRNTNPADFALRAFVEIENAAFPMGWEEGTNGGCWDQLEPALVQVALQAQATLGRLRLHPEAELGVNGRLDWYQQNWPLKLSELAGG